MVELAEKLSFQSVAAVRPRVLLIIPCYNESQNIERLLEEIEGLEEGYETLVVDDGSSDDTFDLASSRANAVRLVCNLGIGGAVQTGIQYAHARNFDYCIQIDGDGQHPPDQIKAMLEHSKDCDANLIIGSRFLGKRSFRSYFLRRIGISIISLTIKSLFGKHVTDPTSGIRLMDRECIRLFSQHYPYDYPEPISCAYALERGLTVAEVPVLMRDRYGGTSSISGLKPIAYMLRVIGYLVLLRLGRHL